MLLTITFFGKRGASDVHLLNAIPGDIWKHIEKIKNTQNAI